MKNHNVKITSVKITGQTTASLNWFRRIGEQEEIIRDPGGS